MTNTNARFVQDINRIVKVKVGLDSNLSEVKAEPISPGRGIGAKVEQSVDSSIASPLKEIKGQREYYEPELLTSSDGLFVMERHVIKKAVFTDVNANTIEIHFEL